MPQKTPFEILLKTASLAPKPGDSQKTILTCLVEEINDLTNEEFDAMPKPCQNWFNQAVGETNTGNKVPPPTGFMAWSKTQEEVASVGETKSIPDKNSEKKALKAAKKALKAEKKAAKKAKKKAESGIEKEVEETPVAEADTKKENVKKKTKKKAKKKARKKAIRVSPLQEALRRKRKDEVTGIRASRDSVSAAQRYILEKGVYNVDVTELIAFIRDAGGNIAPSTAQMAVRRVKSVMTTLFEMGWPSQETAKEIMRDR